MAKILYPRKLVPKSEVKRCLQCQWTLKKDECNQNLHSNFLLLLLFSIINIISIANIREKCEGKKIINIYHMPDHFSVWKLISHFQFFSVFFFLSCQHKTLQNTVILQNEVKGMQPYQSYPPRNTSQISWKEHGNRESAALRYICCVIRGHSKKNRDPLKIHKHCNDVLPLHIQMLLTEVHQRPLHQPAEGYQAVTAQHLHQFQGLVFWTICKWISTSG